MGSFYGHLAQGMALAPDRRSLHFRLHPDARWHDGAPITPEDVKFTFDHVLGTIQGKIFMGWLAAVEITGPRELVFRHKHRFITTDLQWLTYVSILPRALLEGSQSERNDHRSTARQRTVSRGRPQSIPCAIRTRAGLLGAPAPRQPGPAQLRRDSIRPVPDNTVAREAFRKGLFDFRLEEDIGHWISYDTDGRLIRDILHWRVLTGAQRAITLNTRRPHLSDVRVREALTLAMDFDWQNRVYHHGLYERAASYFANSRFAARGVPTGSELEFVATLPGTGSGAGLHRCL